MASELEILIDREAGVVLVEYAVLFALVIVFFGIMINGLFERDPQGNLVVSERIILVKRDARAQPRTTLHFYDEYNGNTGRRDPDPTTAQGDIYIPNPLYGFTSYFQRITDFLALPIP